MLKRHLDNLLTYLKHHITNAVTEGLNSKSRASNPPLAAFATSVTTGFLSCSFAESSVSTHYDPRRIHAAGHTLLEANKLRSSYLAAVRDRFDQIPAAQTTQVQMLADCVCLTMFNVEQPVFAPHYSRNRVDFRLWGRPG